VCSVISYCGKLPKRGSAKARQQSFLRELRFLQTSQKKFLLVELRSNLHYPTDVIARSRQVSGTCAREEGLRTLTSPRREASLFKLGRNQGSGHFLLLADAIRRSLQSSRYQVKQAPDQTADQCSVYADVLEVTTHNEFDSVGEAAGIPLPHDLDKELCQSGTPGHDF
jgi:hypothetical protein